MNINIIVGKTLVIAKSKNFVFFSISLKQYGLHVHFRYFESKFCLLLFQKTCLIRLTSSSVVVQSYHTDMFFSKKLTSVSGPLCPKFLDILNF